MHWLAITTRISNFQASPKETKTACKQKKWSRQSSQKVTIATTYSDALIVKCHWLTLKTVSTGVLTRQAMPTCVALFCLLAIFKN